MVAILKIVLVTFMIGISFVQYYLYKDFVFSKKTDEYDNSNMMGRLLSNIMFFTISSGLVSLFVFLVYILFSKITIG